VDSLDRLLQKGHATNIRERRIDFDASPVILPDSVNAAGVADGREHKRFPHCAVDIVLINCET
jgi:hypothetical protein